MRTPLTEEEKFRARKIAENVLERNRNTDPAVRRVPIARHSLVLLARYVRDLSPSG